METNNRTFVIIPAYKPDEKLLQLLSDISFQTTYNVIVVDDGSGFKYKKIFLTAEKYATVFTIEKNRGKGFAIKRALRYIKENVSGNYVIVTLNINMHHSVKDIVDAAETVREHSGSLVLGCTDLDENNNLISRLYRKFTRFDLSDIRSGLRAFSYKDTTYMIDVPGNRDKYDKNQILKYAKDHKIINFSFI